MEDKEPDIHALEDFEILFRRNHRFLCMIAYKHVGDPYISEDIVQEFFIDFWEKREKITLTSSFEAYASRAVKYKSISWLRSKATKGRKEAHYEFKDSEDPELTVAYIKETEALELKVMQLIEELPAERKKIFMLATTGCLTYKQIAEQLGISVHTVKAQMVKAYATLREKGSPMLYTLLLYLLFSDI